MSNIDDKKIIKIEQELHWHFISVYLSFLRGIPVALADKKFVKLLKELEHYIGYKLETPPEDESLRRYVIDEIELPK